MKQPVHFEQHYLGIALLLCILGYVALAATGKASNDATLTNLAFALAGGLAGATLPRAGTGGPTTVLNDATGATINAAPAAPGDTNIEGGK